MKTPPIVSHTVLQDPYTKEYHVNINIRIKSLENLSQISFSETINPLPTHLASALNDVNLFGPDYYNSIPPLTTADLSFLTNQEDKLKTYTPSNFNSKINNKKQYL